MAEQRGDRFVEVEERYAGYEVYDRDGDKIGKVDDLFVDENDNPEYVGVRMGLFGLSGTTLIPWEKVRAEKGGQRLEVMADKATVKDAPSFNDDEEITLEYERRVYEHYGLQRTEAPASVADCPLRPIKSSSSPRRMRQAPPIFRHGRCPVRHQRQIVTRSTPRCSATCRASNKSFAPETSLMSPSF